MQYFSYGARGAIDGTEIIGPVRQRGADVDFPITDFVLTQSAGKANGYAALDGSGNVTAPLLSPSGSIGNETTSFWNAFGVPVLQVGALGGANSIVGLADNQTAAGTSVFPTGVTGAGKLNSAGGQVFGLFGRADAYTAGVATNEVNSFNYTTGAASSALPPNRAFGTTQTLPVALTVAAGGSYASAIGIDICQEGNHPQPFLTGLYLDPAGVTTYGVMIDATATVGPASPLVVKGANGSTQVSIITSGTYQANYAVLTSTDASGTVRAAIKQDGSYVGGVFTLDATGGNFANTGTTNYRVTGQHNFYTPSGPQLQIFDGGGNGANYAQIKGAGTGFGVIYGAAGSDANVNLILRPQGTGVVVAPGLAPAAGANLVLGPSGAQATTATTGYIQIPTCAGSPTGTPSTNNGASLIFDTTDTKLWAYSPTAAKWVGVALA